MLAGKVSIIITCYDQGWCIIQAIESALAQTYSDVETIVVNDGSTDNSLDIIRRYGPRVILVDQENQGVGDARDQGIAKSCGEYLLPLDGDDMIDSDFLSKTVPIMADPQVGVVSTDMQYFGLRRDLIKTTGLSLEVEMVSNQIPICSLIRRTAYARTSGYAQKNIAPVIQDWNMWVSILKQGWKIVRVPEPLFYYRIRKDSMCSQSLGLKAELKQIQNQHPELKWEKK